MASNQGAQLQCPLRFDPQPRGASLIRLTPQMRSALQDAQASGMPAALRFSKDGTPNVIQVGRHTFEFTVRKEDRVCDLLRLPAVDGTAAIEIGSVQQSLLVKRDLEAERLRMRQRSQQADEQQHLRTTVLLENSGRKASGQRPRSVLASGNGGLHAAPHRGLHGDKQRGGSPAPRAQSPALPAEGPHRSQSPALAAQPQVAAKKNAARSKLGLLRGSARPASASPAPLAAGLVDGRVLAAARKGGVRMCLIAVLAAKALNRQGVEQALAEVARRVPGFKVSGDIQTSLRNVATYQSPGRYLLHKHLLRELEGLSADELHADDSTGIRAGSPVSKAAKQPTAEQAQQGLEPASGGKRRSQQGAAQAQAQPAKRHRLAVAAEADKAVAGPAVEASQSAHAAHGQAAPSPADSPPVAPAQPQAASRQRSATPRSDTLPAAAAPQQPAKLAETHRPPSASPTPTPSPSVRAGSGRLGSSGRLDSSGGRGSGGQRGGSTTSRSSSAYDESWFASHTGRSPVVASPVSSLAQFADAKAQYNNKHEVYFRLHQEIQAHQRDLSGLRRAAQLAASPNEAKRWEDQATRLWQKRHGRHQRWQSAFDVLDAELTSLKAAMRAYSDRQRQQPAAASTSAPIAAQ